MCVFDNSRALLHFMRRTMTIYKNLLLLLLLLLRQNLKPMSKWVNYTLLSLLSYGKNVTTSPLQCSVRRSDFIWVVPLEVKAHKISSKCQTTPAKFLSETNTYQFSVWPLQKMEFLSHNSETHERCQVTWTLRQNVLKSNEIVVLNETDWLPTQILSSSTNMKFWRTSFPKLFLFIWAGLQVSISKQYL
jgi:hypothetical protein